MENDAYILAANGGENYYFLFSLCEYEDVPIVFAAKNDSNQLFLCNCVEMRQFQRWIIAKTDYSILKKVVSQEITVYNALTSLNKMVTVAEYNYQNDSFSQQLDCDVESLSESYLPSRGAFLLYPCDGVETNIKLLSMADTSDKGISWKDSLLDAETDSNDVVNDNTAKCGIDNNLLIRLEQTSIDNTITIVSRGEVHSIQETMPLVA